MEGGTYENWDKKTARIWVSQIFRLQIEPHLCKTHFGNIWVYVYLVTLQSSNLTLVRVLRKSTAKTLCQRYNVREDFGNNVFLTSVSITFAEQRCDKATCNTVATSLFFMLHGQNDDGE